MANFEVPVVRIDAIEEHPNADSLEIAVVGGYRSIAKIGTFKAGDIAVYIPEAAVLPDWLIKKMGLWNEKTDKGNLAGKQGNRVKAIKLRGVVSQGLLYPILWDDEDLPYIETDFIKLTDGSMIHDTYYLYDYNDSRKEDIASRCVDIDVSYVLGITKYEPPIPAHMSGEVANVFGHTLKFDIENIQRYPTILQEGEEVVFTEKLHGTWTCFGIVPDLEHEDFYEGCAIITSKGLSEKGLAFKYNDANAHNLYVAMFAHLMVTNLRFPIFKSYAEKIGGPVYLLGEIIGKGVQDLQYGLEYRSFRGFDVYIGKPGEGKFLDYEAKKEVFHDMLDMNMVPVLYTGPFSTEVVEKYRDGQTRIANAHMREGIVITPVKEREDITLGRVCLKAVSPDYLLRKSKNATEYN